MNAISDTVQTLAAVALFAEGTTVILSSHVMGFIERICSRVCVLKKGEIVAEGPPASLRDKAAMPDDAFDDVFLHFAL